MDKSRRPITLPEGVKTLLWCLLFCAPLGIWSILYFATADLPSVRLFKL